jgi:hypothetical protein
MFDLRAMPEDFYDSPYPFTASFAFATRFTGCPTVSYFLTRYTDLVQVQVQNHDGHPVPAQPCGHREPDGFASHNDRWMAHGRLYQLRRGNKAVGRKIAE